jgi:hypothetical protein
VATLTQADVDRLKAKLDAGDRAGFYLLYHDLTGSNEALTQAEVASFSGELGRMAMQANSAIQAYLWAMERGNQYPGTVDNFSQIIAKHLYDRIAEDVANGRTGVFKDEEIFNRAKEQWGGHGIGDCFPGNLRRLSFPGWCSLFGGIAAGQDAEAIGLPAGPAIPPGGQQLTTPDGQATYIIDGSGAVAPGSVLRTPAAPSRRFDFDATRPDDHGQINAPDRAGQAASVAPNDGGSVPYQWPGITAGGMPPWIPALTPSPPSVPGGPFDWLQSDLLGKVGGLMPSGALGPPQPNISGALSAPPQTRITPQPFPAPPPSPFGPAVFRRSDP